MPEIKLFDPSRMMSARPYEVVIQKSIMLGNWRFYLTARKPVYAPDRIGMNQLQGYEETYSNPFISQEETDRLMQKWQREKETGIIETEE